MIHFGPFASFWTTSLSLFLIIPFILDDFDPFSFIWCFLLVHFIHFHSTYVTRFFLFCLIFVNWAFARLFRSKYFSQTGDQGFKSTFLSCSMTSKEEDSAKLQHHFVFKTKENNRSLLIRKGFKQYTFCPKHLIMGNKIKHWHYNRELPTCKIITLPLWQESTCTLAPQYLFDKHNRK